MRTIFVDMDGVLSNFDKAYLDLFGEKASVVARNKKQGQYSTYWNKFVDTKQFEKLEYFPNALELINFLNVKAEEYKFQLAVLTSSGGFDRHNDVLIQKRNWLLSHNIQWPLCCVPGRRFKAGYATKYSFLIDDTLDVVDAFIAKGGFANLYTPELIPNTYREIGWFLEP